jgi:hypothetical protein
VKRKAKKKRRDRDSCSGKLNSGKPEHVFTEEFISILRPDSFLNARHPQAKPFRARSIGLYLVGHRPVHSEGGYSLSSGLNAICTLLCPRSTGLAPSVALRLLNNGLLNNFARRTRATGTNTEFFGHEVIE